MVLAAVMSARFSVRQSLDTTPVSKVKTQGLHILGALDR
jgi:hypothetical protein